MVDSTALAPDKIYSFFLATLYHSVLNPLIGSTIMIFLSYA